MNDIDLINGKTIYCPECARHLKPQGRINGTIANVMAYCPMCKKDYSWVAYIDKNNKHVISMFKQHIAICDNSNCHNAPHCPNFDVNNANLDFKHIPKE